MQELAHQPAEQAYGATTTWALAPPPGYPSRAKLEKNSRPGALRHQPMGPAVAALSARQRARQVRAALVAAQPAQSLPINPNGMEQRGWRLAWPQGKCFGRPGGLFLPATGPA